MELEDIVEILKNDPQKVIPKLLDDVREQYGEVPYIMNFMKDLPEIFIPKTLYDNSIMREVKNLDQETVELISIGVASTLRCEHCLKMHLRIAKRKEISKEKIVSAIMIGASLSNAAVLAESKRALTSEFPNKSNENKEEKELVCTPDCEVCKTAGKNLDQESIELISIGVASALRCEHCLRTHLRIVKRKGISKEKIFSAIMIGASLSNAAVLAESTRALASEFPDENGNHKKGNEEEGEEEEQCCDPNCEVCNIAGANIK
jgi:AhpD family alkylhydroperoxidase